MIKGNALGHTKEKEKKTGAAMPLRSGWQHEGLVTDPPHARDPVSFGFPIWSRSAERLCFDHVCVCLREHAPIESNMRQPMVQPAS